MVERKVQTATGMAQKGAVARFRESAETFAEYEAAAESAGMKLSEWLRAACRAYLSGSGGVRLPTTASFLTAWATVERHSLQSESAAILEYGIKVAAELLDDPAGGSPVPKRRK